MAAVGDAYKVIQRNVADVMIAGGTEAPITRLAMAGFCANKAMTTNLDAENACRPFDAERDGFVMGEGAARCMNLALADAGLNPTDIQYINAHGTSTELNDRTETAAIKSVFGSHAYQRVFRIHGLE